MSDAPAAGSEPQAPRDTPWYARKTVWATTAAAVFGLMTQAPELAHTLLPFVPDQYRERVISGAAFVAMLAGILANRSAAGNAHRAAQERIGALEDVVRQLR